MYSFFSTGARPKQDKILGQLLAVEQALPLRRQRAGQGNQGDAAGVDLNGETGCVD